MGDNISMLAIAAAGKALVRLTVQQRMLRRLFHLLRRILLVVPLFWVQSELNPADPWSRLSSRFQNDHGAASEEAMHRFWAATSCRDSTLVRVWVLGLPRLPSSMERVCAGVS